MQREQACNGVPGELPRSAQGSSAPGLCPAFPTPVLPSCHCPHCSFQMRWQTLSESSPRPSLPSSLVQLMPTRAHGLRKTSDPSLAILCPSGPHLASPPMASQVGQIKTTRCAATYQVSRNPKEQCHPDRLGVDEEPL